MTVIRKTLFRVNIRDEEDGEEGGKNLVSLNVPEIKIDNIEDILVDQQEELELEDCEDLEYEFYEQEISKL